MTEERALASGFRERAAERLRQEGRYLADEKALRLAAGREKRLWISQRLVDLGMERARHCGWPNTYTLTKSLGEQLIAKSGVRHAIVRPAIVESALRYPFPGWNEGFTTSAPLAFLALKGARGTPTGEKAVLDVVPVDLAAGATLAATAELVERRERLRRAGAPAPASGRVYHLASGDTNEAEAASLSAPQLKLLDNLLRDFRLAGVALPAGKKLRYRELMQQLATVQSKFDENVLDATQAWTRHVTDAGELAGLPAGAMSRAAQTARERGLDGWLITVDEPNYVAVWSTPTARR